MHNVFKFGRRQFRAAAVLILFPVVSGVSVASADGQGETPYKVVCEGEKPVCKVDKGTYKGWRTYHAVCHVCHAQDAVGSTFAPSLVDRLKGMDKEKFMDVVLNGFTGEVGVMPGWKEDPNVLPRMEDLWGYLKARSDGVLSPGKPRKLP
ncbi:c-type cytochrome [Emcibacter sp.]|uniref:c-type cytochrome n=1 Tax=Emcibacter sp. TaxID=1979954 RepID=UPI003A8D4815